jgi:hypothetical protein
MTPFNDNGTNKDTNKSYLNTTNNGSRQRLSASHNNNNNKSNANGSFIDTSGATPARPTETQLNTVQNSGRSAVPTFKISEAVDAITTAAATETSRKFVEKCCKNCQKKFISQQNQTSNKTNDGQSNELTANTRKRKAVTGSDENGKDLLAEFNLNIADYSPNKKCASYLTSNSFSPCLNNRNGAPPSPSGTPQSVAKKSLLAKAITNNVTNTMMCNVSVNDVSLNSGNVSAACSSMLDVSPVSSPSKSSRLAEMDAESDHRGADEDGDEEIADEEQDDDMLNESICEECKIKEAKIEYASIAAEDRSEVSLIMGKELKV